LTQEVAGKAELAEAFSVSEKQQRILLEKDRERKAELAEALSVSGKQQRHMQELTSTWNSTSRQKHFRRDVGHGDRHISKSIDLG
jgi:hypothetical protein